MVGKLRRKQQLYSEYEHVFVGTRLALGGLWRCNGPPPAALPGESGLQLLTVSQLHSAHQPLLSPVLPPRRGTVALTPISAQWRLPAVTAKGKRGSFHRRSYCLVQQYHHNPGTVNPPKTLMAAVHNPPNPKTVYCNHILGYPININ